MKTFCFQNLKNESITKQKQKEIQGPVPGGCPGAGGVSSNVEKVLIGHVHVFLSL